MALGTSGGLPVGTVGHDRGEDRFALPVGPFQGLVFGGQRVLGRGVVVVAALPAARASAAARRPASRASLA